MGQTCLLHILTNKVLVDYEFIVYAIKYYIEIWRLKTKLAIPTENTKV